LAIAIGIMMILIEVHQRNRTFTYSNAAYVNLMREDFMIWNRACLQMTQNEVDEKDFDRKLFLLDSVMKMIRKNVKILFGLHIL
jgi:hypothetical protein